MINQNDLIYFLELTKTKHVSRAAERLGVTQPTLSHCIKRLENAVGTILFIRTKKGIELTPAADRLLESSEELILKWNEVVKSANDEVDEAKGLIRLGVHTAVAQYMLPQVLPEFLKQHSEIQISLEHGLSRHMTEKVISSSLDVSFAVNPVDHPDLVIKELILDRVTLWRSKNVVNNDVLIVEPSLLQSQSLLQKLNKKGLNFKRKIESQSLEVIAQLVQSGAGSAILPERVMKAFCDSSVVQIKDAPEMSDRICIVYLQKFRKLKRGQVFIDHVKSLF
jgi:LysR family transcriptional regulator, cell division regulator